MGWTDAEIQQVKTLWNEGLGGSQIADALGKRRNGVQGLIYRLRQKGEKLEARSTNNYETSSKQRSIRARKKHNGKRTPAQRDWARGDQPPTEEVPPVKTEQHLIRAIGQLDVPFLENTGCKWPAWPPTEKSGPCCGLPKKGGPWCPFHASVAWSQSEGVRKRVRGMRGWP